MKIFLKRRLTYAPFLGIEWMSRYKPRITASNIPALHLYTGIKIYLYQLKQYQTRKKE